MTDLGITATPYSLKETCQKGIMEPHSLCPPLQTANAFFTWLCFILIPVNQAGLWCKETGSAKVWCLQDAPPGARSGASWSRICLFSLISDITLSLSYFWPQRLQNDTSWVVSCVPCKIPVGFNIFMVHNQSFRILTITSLLRVWEHSKQSCFQREGKYLCTKPSDLLKMLNCHLLPPTTRPRDLQAHSQVILLLD